MVPLHRLERMLLVRTQLRHSIQLIERIVIAPAFIRKISFAGFLSNRWTFTVLQSILRCLNFTSITQLEVLQYLIWIIKDYGILRLLRLLLRLLFQHFLMLLDLLLFCFHLLLVNKSIVYSVIQVRIVIRFIFSVEISAFLTKLNDF